MTYTNNVPQANQTIASTQGPILNNFGYLQTEQQVEHAFNNVPAGQANGTHLKASMPNMTLSPSLPALCNGVYFVNSSMPYFYNGTTNFPLFQNYMTQGSNSVATNTAFQILPAGSYMGTVSAFQSGSPTRYQLLQFWLNGSTLVSNGLADGGSGNITLKLDGSNNLQILNSSSSTQTIKWQVFYSGSAP